MKKALLTLAALAGALCLYAQNADEPVYADSSTQLEKYMVPATGDFATPDKDGFLGRWLLLEPISKPIAATPSSPTVTSARRSPSRISRANSVMSSPRTVPR